ncbi:MAG: aldose 1-epimerase family protein [Clostridia bacterium]|nr:aldose 1-epimerase family protein [Clostridia bacterium]
MTHTIHNDKLTITVNERGAELFSVKSTDGTEYLWQGTAPYWNSRASNIFPVCGRFFGGKYTYRDESYEMRCHGFARGTDFALESADDNSLVFTLIGNDETKKVYPFDFELKIIYTLEGNTLNCRFHITNTGDDILPFATGGHPGFNVPLADGLSFEDYYVDFGNIENLTKMIFSDTCFVTGKDENYPLRDGRYIDLKHSLFDNDAIFFKNVPTSVTLASNKDKHSVTVTCPQVKYFGLWHSPLTEAPFVCLEPWIGLPSMDGVDEDLATKPELVRLSSGDSFDFTYAIRFN